MNKRSLILEDGTILTGKAFGCESGSEGTVIFYSSMTGYQEMLTDPNYYGHIVTMTFPLIGNYGVNRDDFESIEPYIKGVVVKEISHLPSNFRSEETLDDFLKRQQIPGIAGIDTRMLTRLIRKKGRMRGILTNINETPTFTPSLFNEPAENVVEKTSITKPYIVPGRGKRVTIVDLGMKQSILHELTERDCNVTVVPYNYNAEEILRFKPDGVLFSNGPGDPHKVTSTITTIQNLLGKIPIFGIGLGHQLLALANGAKVKKLHVGNYGTNYVVQDVVNNRSFSTTQSRDFYVEESSIEKTNLQVIFRSSSDGSIEGLQHKEHNAFSVQFNPEGAPGPNDTNFLFDTFIENLSERKANEKGRM